MDTPRGNRLKRLFLGISIVLLTLGVGNIAFGTYKMKEHLFILSEALRERTIPKVEQAPFSIPILDRYVNLDKQAQHISRVQSRVSFYEFVILGGKGILAIGAIFLLAGVVAKPHPLPL